MSTLQSVPPSTMRRALELAGLAPSIHNSQPWQFDVHETRIDLYANLQRWLPATDVDRRDLMLSCGAALHHLRLGLAAAGLHDRTHRLPASQEADLLASVEIVPGSGRATSDLAAQIPRRRSDRRAYRHWPIPEEFIRALVASASDQGAVLRMVDQPRPREALINAFRRAQLAQDHVVGYSGELTIWTGLATGSEGIPAANLPASSSPAVSAQRRFDRGTLPTPATGTEEDMLAVLGTASDDQLSQLRAGEALSAVLLVATRLGLASCCLSQPLEVETTWRSLRDDVCEGTLSPQIVIRLGWPQDEPLPATPRRPVEEIVGRLPR